MDRFLRPERFDIEPSTPGATKEWLHWLCTFENFLESLTDLSRTTAKQIEHFDQLRIAQSV